MRILVCGSRNFTDEELIERVLSKAKKLEQPITLVHGDCPRGADNIADRIARKFGWNIEKHPAQWDLHGKKAGFLRNAEMVNTGVDYCLAFTTHNGDEKISQGTSHTVNLARKKNITTRVFFQLIEQ